MVRTDYHMHLERGPWTLDWLGKFVDAARSRGLAEIGFSEHPHRFRAYRDMYLGLLEEARGAGLPVRTGMEWDFICGKEALIDRAIRAYPWDYAIGSVHWLPPDTPAEPWWDFDNLANPAAWERRDVRAAYRRYFDLIIAAAGSGLFDVIGHADVIKVLGYRPEEDIADLYTAAAGAFAAGGVCVEINTAGWRKPVGEAYPAPAFLHACRRAGVPLVINSDAHLPEDVGRDFDRAAALARAAGYTEVATFSRRVRRMTPL
jgi:histidinol-phosphatase (PHP family)